MKSKTLLLIIIILLLTGCYDHKELNKIAILTATEINKNNDEFIINAEVVNPQSPDKTTYIQAPFIIYTGKGKTISEAYRQIKLSSSRYLYPDHLSILIINEKIAKEDITEIFDFYLRNPSVRTEFNVLIGKNEDILSLTTPIDKLSSSSILESIKTNNQYQGITNLVTLDDMSIMYLNPHKEIILPSIKIENDNKDSDNIKNTEDTKIDSTYKLSNLAVFKGNKLQGYLTNDESITYNLITNNVKNSIITYECENNKYLTAEIITSSSKIKPKNNEINIDINISTVINESNCNIELNNAKTIKQLEKDLSSYLKEKTEKNINNIRKKYNSDIFGFLDEIYKHDYKTYQKVKNNWYNQEFKNIKININSQINIIGKGNIMEGNNEKN